MKTVLALALFALVSGCATTPTPVAEVKPIAADRLLALQENTGAATGAIVVTRDVGFINSACYSAVHINGTLAARFASGETARFLLPPGDVLLRVGRDPQGKGLCGLDKERWTQRETVLRQNEVKHFRLTTDSNGNFDIVRGD
ncbi:hypothetical protein [Collimonas humicola]|uniref:hypothetical protein n=1 Tax=Collimonas humicola TaxID=2825886 RepID=UPI001B8BD082|nr:hypothetical protein [Collimonas humicola]